MSELQHRRSSDPEGELHCGIGITTHEKHHEFIDTLIEDHKYRIAFRKSVIEKTTSSLVWTFLVFVSVSCWKYITEHWK
jgi:hypothetical protein